MYKLLNDGKDSEVDVIEKYLQEEHTKASDKIRDKTEIAQQKIAKLSQEYRIKMMAEIAPNNDEIGTLEKEIMDRKKRIKELGAQREGIVDKYQALLNIDRKEVNAENQSFAHSVYAKHEKETDEKLRIEYGEKL
jgi:hypothetical protein